MVKICKFTIQLTNDLEDVIEHLAGAFRTVGWFIFEQTTDAVTVRSPSSIYDNKHLFVKFNIFLDKNLTYGVNASVYKETELVNGVVRPKGNPIIFGSTINTIGEYALVANETSFVLVPPVTQTHRFRYGTWAGLLKVADGTPHSLSDGNFIPLFFLSDRQEGSLLREYPHTDPTSPLHFVQTPSGMSFNIFLPLKVTAGYRWVQDRGFSKTVINLLTLGVMVGDCLVPVLYSPSAFIIWKPERQFYYAPASSLKDFLVSMETPVGTLITAAELPPDGAILAFK